MFDTKQKTSNYMSLVATHNCNKKCSFCVDSYRGSGEFITPGLVDRAVEVATSNGVKDILIVGGEPTLHPHIVNIVKTTREAGFRTIMTTNYTLPNVVKRLDGLVDCFNISHYGQKEIPKQVDFSSDLTLHSLIHKQKLNTKEQLDCFIDVFQKNINLKFSTLSPCNDWATKNQLVQYVDWLDCEWVVLFNEILGQVYRGTTIKRYDRVINKAALQSIKFHVDGEISHDWKRQAKNH